MNPIANLIYSLKTKVNTYLKVSQDKTKVITIPQISTNNQVPISTSTNNIDSIIMPILLTNTKIKLLEPITFKVYIINNPILSLLLLIPLFMIAIPKICKRRTKL
jgi:hypothetical protein